MTRFIFTKYYLTSIIGDRPRFLDSRNPLPCHKRFIDVTPRISFKEEGLGIRSRHGQYSLRRLIGAGSDYLVLAVGVVVVAAAGNPAAC